jgi:hypothetical protein
MSPEETDSQSPEPTATISPVDTDSQSPEPTLSVSPVETPSLSLSVSPVETDSQSPAPTAAVSPVETPSPSWPASPAETDSQSSLRTAAVSPHESAAATPRNSPDQTIALSSLATLPRSLARTVTISFSASSEAVLAPASSEAASQTQDSSAVFGVVGGVLVALAVALLALFVFCRRRSDPSGDGAEEEQQPGTTFAEMAIDFEEPLNLVSLYQEPDQIDFEGEEQENPFAEVFAEWQ